MLCHKIVHIASQCKCNYVVLIILQIIVQSWTRTASAHMSGKWMCMNFNKFNKCDMKESRNTLIKVNILHCQ